MQSPSPNLVVRQAIELSESRANWPSVLFILIVVVNITAIALAHNVYLLAALVLLQSILMIGIQEAKHQCVHYQFLTWRKINDGLGMMFAALFGVNFIGYRQFHQKHHRRTCQSDDPEGLLYELSWRTRCICVFGAVEQIWVAWHINRISRNFVPSSKTGLWRFCNTLLFVNAAILAISLFFAPVTVLCAYVIPFCLFSWIDFFFTQAEHYGVPIRQCKERRSPAEISIDIVLPYWLSCLMLHRPLHQVHHVAPGTRWFQAPLKLRLLGVEGGIPASTLPGFYSRWFAQGPRLWNVEVPSHDRR